MDTELKEKAEIVLEVLLKNGKKELAILEEERRQLSLSMVFMLSTSVFMLLMVVGTIFLIAYVPPLAVLGVWPYLIELSLFALFLVFFLIFLHRRKVLDQKIEERKANNALMAKTLSETNSESL